MLLFSFIFIDEIISIWRNFKRL